LIFENVIDLHILAGRRFEVDMPHLAALTAPEVLELQGEGAIVVDTRPAMQFAVAHVPGPCTSPSRDSNASWAARMLGLDMPTAGEDREHVRESPLRLARVGFENVAGYLADVVAGWIQNASSWTSQRGDRELVSCIPLGKLRSRLTELDRGKLLVVQCKGGYRSSIATSILRRAGFHDSEPDRWFRRMENARSAFGWSATTGV